MKILPVGAELLHADGWADGRTDRQTEKTDKHDVSKFYIILTVHHVMILVE